MNAYPKPQRNAGFSMLEVLIALVIILTGILGALGIQLTSINNAQEAKYKSIAALLASNIVAEMQGNVAYWATLGGNYLFYNIDNTGISTYGDSLDRSALAAKCATVCTPAQMAALDLTQWGTSISSTLPGSHGSIYCNANTATTVGYCYVYVYWTVKNVGPSKVTNPLNMPGMINYQTRVVFN